MIRKIFAVALVLVALSACRKTPEDTIVPVASVAISQTEAEMELGETLQLQAQISPSNATEQKVMWGSSKQSVATVSDAGLVTAVGEGSAKITATVSGKTATCVVTVTKPEVPVVHVGSVTLDKTDASLEIGQSLTLTATVLPENAADKSVEWKSTNPAIAEVDQNGTVTAISSGAVTITVTTNDGEKAAACEITVTEVFVPVESVTFEHTDLIVFKGDSYQINVTVLPENATNKTITWTSSDPAIASISPEGIITGLGSGQVEITAKAGDIVATCVVMAIVIVDEFDGEENGHYWVDLGLPSGIKWATCNVGADNATQTGSWFAWGETFARESSDNPPYSLFDSATGKYTKYVTDSKYGDVDNRTFLEPQDDAAHVQWGGDWCMPTEANVKELMDNCDHEFIQQYGIWGMKFTSKINSHTIFLPATEYYEQMDYYVGDYLTTSLKKDDSRYAKIWHFASSELVSGIGPRDNIYPVRAVVGTTYIPVESLESDESDITILTGQTRTLSVRVLPENATDKAVAWTSDDESVAVVDKYGNMTAVGSGYTYVRAIAGGKKYSFYVKVIPVLENLSIDPVDMTLLIGETASVTVTVSPGDLFGYYYYQHGYSVDEYNVLRITNVSDDNNGKITFNITAIAGGEAKLVYYIEVDGEPVVVTCHVTVPYVDDPYDGETDGHKWVDMGLPSGIKWATCNVGAIYSIQLGSKFAWGETEPKSEGSGSYKWYDGSGQIIKYCNLEGWGVVDNLTALEAGDDAATAAWGQDWCMPTEDDVFELMQNSSYEIINQNGIIGAKVTSKINSHAIFLPARMDQGGYSVDYFTSTLGTGTPITAMAMFFDDSNAGTRAANRYNEVLPVRAIVGKSAPVQYVPVESVDFGYSHVFLSVGDVRYLDVDISPSNATNKKVTWSSDDESVAVVDSNGKLTCVGAGSAIIYAEADGKKDFFILRVDPHINSITIEPSELNLTVGQTATVTVRIDPDVPLGTFGMSTWGSVFDIQHVGDNPITYRVTAFEEGTGSFTFHAYGAEATGTVTVTAAKAGTLAELKQMADAGQDCSSYLGYVFTTSGKIFKDAASIPSDGGSPVAMIAYIGAKGSADSSLGSSKYNGLAIALRNAASMNWGRKDNAYLDTPEFTNCNNISAALADMAGIGHTNIMSERYYSTADAANNYVVSGFNPSDFGCSSWFVPTAGQWAKYLNAMYGHTWSNFGEPDQYQYGVNFCAAIDNDIIAAGGTSLFTYHSGSNAYYWTSSEVDNLSAIQMGFTYDAYQGREYFYAASKENAFQLRCFIAF